MRVNGTNENTMWRLKPGVELKQKSKYCENAG